jgi:hypothetical protein
VRCGEIACAATFCAKDNKVDVIFGGEPGAALAKVGHSKFSQEAQLGAIQAGKDLVKVTAYFAEPLRVHCNRVIRGVYYNGVLFLLCAFLSLLPSPQAFRIRPHNVKNTVCCEACATLACSFACLRLSGYVKRAGEQRAKLSRVKPRLSACHSVERYCLSAGIAVRY